MYYDRKNTIFDKKTILIPLSISTEKVFNRSILKVLLIVENIGIRHVAFRNFYINITSLVDESQSYELSALSFKYFHSEEFTTPGSQSIIIKPNTIVDLEINFPNLFGQGFQTDKFVQNGIRFRTIIIGQTVEHEIVEGKFDQFFDLGQKEIKSI